MPRLAGYAIIEAVARPLALLLLALVLPTCGGPQIAIDLVIAPGATPFAGVSTVRLSASGPGMERVSATAAYEHGAAVELPRLPPGEQRIVVVEGLDAEGAVLARGESAPFAVSADGPERVSVVFAACPSTLHRDADGDGHGDPQRAKRACPAPGWVTSGDDCNDGDPEVHPQQTKYFAQPQSLGTGKPFDYDCDGLEERGYDTLAAPCTVSYDCRGASGWCAAGGTRADCRGIPACGEVGAFQERCLYGPPSDGGTGDTGGAEAAGPDAGTADGGGSDAGTGGSAADAGSGVSGDAVRWKESPARDIVDTVGWVCEPEYTGRTQTCR